jgi:thymidylate kinase
MDHTTGAWVHLHVYYRIITGESLLKNYGFPLEGLLLRDRREVHGVPAPQLPAELMLFVIRIMLKHASILEYLILRRDRAAYESLRDELEALLIGDSAARCCELLAQWLPAVDRVLFMQCLESLRSDTPLVRRVRLAWRLRRQLKLYHRFSFVRENYLRTTIFLKRVLRRIQRRKSKQLAAGGLLIAFVGPEATGKSTLVSETMRWLGQEFEIESAHLGKPASTGLTFLPNLVAPLMRRATPQHRTSRMTNGSDDSVVRKPSLLYALRSVLIAWDRRALAVKLRRKAVDGRIVVCDRYPSATLGAMDSARLPVAPAGGKRRSLLNFLAKIENHLYRQIPAPDVVIRLSVPLDVAIERNRVRQKPGKETDAYVLRRHMSSPVPVFPSARTFELDSNQSRSQTVNSVRQILWDVL